MKRHWFLTMGCLLAVQLVFAQHFSFTNSSFGYKKVEGHELKMDMYQPEIETNEKLPAIVFFFGGGWVSGTPEHFKMQAEYLASRGMVVFCPDYRTKSKQGTSPFECVKDAKSAMRYIRSNAKKFGIDANRIVAAGGSAGGHLAACTAIIESNNESTDDLAVSAKPFALVLFNPVLDTSERGYGSSKVAGRETEISPVHHIKSGLPPTLVMHGTADTTVPFENAKRFTALMQKHGNECKLVSYEKQSHGFFNYRKEPECFRKTLAETEKFLEKLELLQGSSWVNEYFKSLN